jgi:hypothetical protein
MIKACAGYLPGYSLKTNWTFMNTHKPTPLFWNIVRGFSGMIFALLTLYLVNDLIDGSIEYGICGGRMSKNCNTLELTTPIELLIGLLHLGTLSFALGCLAIRPQFFLRKEVLAPTIVLFLIAHLSLIVLWLKQ